MPDNVVIQRSELDDVSAIFWLAGIEGMTAPHPGEVYGAELWEAVVDAGRLGLAVVKPEQNEVTRIGVVGEDRRGGVGTALIDRLYEEYGPLELVCRESRPANDFYAATGWEKTGTEVAEPEDLVRWRYDPKQTVPE